MKAVYYIDGLVIDFNNELMQHQKLQVNVTKDSIGCTLSIGSEKHGMQFTIPFDAILKELNSRR